MPGPRSFTLKTEAPEDGYTIEKGTSLEIPIRVMRTEKMTAPKAPKKPKGGKGAKGAKGVVIRVVADAPPKGVAFRPAVIKPGASEASLRLTIPKFLRGANEFNLILKGNAKVGKKEETVTLRAIKITVVDAKK